MNSSSENQVPSVTGNRSGVEHTLSASDNAAIVNERGSLKRQTLKRTICPCQRMLLTRPQEGNQTAAASVAVDGHSVKQK